MWPSALLAALWNMTGSGGCPLGRPFSHSLFPFAKNVLLNAGQNVALSLFATFHVG
jgi:hypothetical protein